MRREAFEDRNVTSSVCHSSPTGLSDLMTNIDKCTTSDEVTRKAQLASTISKLETDIEFLKANVGNSLAMGDSMFGTFGHVQITNEVKERNTELNHKKDNLMKEIDNKEKIIERSDRDFSDVKESLPETQKKNKLNFIEDYTLAFLSISYFFMIIAFIYYQTATAMVPATGFFQSLMISVVVSMIVFMLIYYIA